MVLLIQMGQHTVPSRETQHTEHHLLAFASGRTPLGSLWGLAPHSTLLKGKAMLMGWALSSLASSQHHWPLQGLEVVAGKGSLSSGCNIKTSL